MQSVTMLLLLLLISSDAFSQTPSAQSATAAVTIRLRCAPSRPAEPPLYVVDGVVLRELPDIDPNTIASIEVLKDTALALISCRRPVSGVVLITTKKRGPRAIRILDGEDGTPVEGATVRLLSANRTDTGFLVSDAQGTFTMEPGARWKEALISSVGYIDQNIHLTGAEEIRLERGPKTCSTVTVIAYGRGRFCRSVCRGIRVTTRYDGDQAVSGNATARLYPNPARPGASITLNRPELNEGTWELSLLTAAGQLVLRLEVTGANTASLRLPGVPAGLYLLSARRKESGARFTEKLVVH